MTASHGQTVRKIPVAPGSVPEVLVRLSHDASDDRLCWRLGSHGRCEIATPRSTTSVADPTLLAATTGRLFGPDGVSSCDVVIALHSLDDDACELLLDADALEGPWFAAEPAGFAGLRRAALRELAEDLRFHAARAAATAQAA